MNWCLKKEISYGRSHELEALRCLKGPKESGDKPLSLWGHLGSGLDSPGQRSQSLMGLGEGPGSNLCAQGEAGFTKGFYTLHPVTPS